MNLLILATGLIVSSLLVFGWLYGRKPTRRPHTVQSTARVTAVIFGASVVLLGLSLRTIGAPLEGVLFPFLAICGVQILLAAVGFDFGGSSEQLAQGSAGVIDGTQIELLTPAQRERGLLRKWFHPIYFLLALALGILIGHKINLWTSFGAQDPQRPYVLHSEPWMLITSVGLLVLVIVKDRYFETLAIRALENITKVSEDHQRTLTKWIQDHLSPTIISLSNRNDVLAKASSIIDTAISEKHEPERYVVFTGSAALYKDIDEQETDTDTPLSKYRSAMARLTNSSVVATRYISLLDRTDFKRRGENTRADYIKWIEKQITLVERNPNYSLYHCPRAPNWGSSRSSIFTAKALLDIVGNGEGGILIRGEQVAQNLAESTKQLFEINAAVKPLIYDKPALLSYLKKLRGTDDAETNDNDGPKDHQ
jgi:hypothetical protein